MVSGGIGSSVSEVVPDHYGSGGWTYEPKTKETTTIDTCFTWATNFDNNDVLWSTFACRRRGVVRHEDLGQDARREESAGLSAFILDYNGNGKRDAYTEPDQPADPTKDKRISVAYYGDAPGAGRLDLGISPECRARWFASFRDLTRPRRR
jgi:hypothetical protein